MLASKERRRFIGRGFVGRGSDGCRPKAASDPTHSLVPRPRQPSATALRATFLAEAYIAFEAQQLFTHRNKTSRSMDMNPPISTRTTWGRGLDGSHRSWWWRRCRRSEQDNRVGTSPDTWVAVLRRVFFSVLGVQQWRPNQKKRLLRARPKHYHF